MGLYKLTNITQNIEEGLVEKIQPEAIDYESYFECWLENNPSLLLDEDEGVSTILWIGRQLTAAVGDTDKFPDLVGIDAAGDVVIVELKRGKTPREVIAQILEYASWTAQLDYPRLDELARTYYSAHQEYAGMSLKEIHQDVFGYEVDFDFEKIINRAQKLYIVAEKISSEVRQVSEYLREQYKLPIFHLEYEVMRTKDQGYIISIEKTLGYDMPNLENRKVESPRRVSSWNSSEKIKDVIHREVETFLKVENITTFKPKDAIKYINDKYPDILTNTIRCQLIQDCVNHTSRKHYPSGQQDRYYLDSKGIYRLYNAGTDGRWDRNGERVGWE